MTEPDETGDADRALLASLGEAIADPLPHGLIERATGLMAWSNVDGELAELLDAPLQEMAGTRGSHAAPQLLEFAVTDGGLIELTIDSGGIKGQVLGNELAAVTLERGNGDTQDGDVDELGSFTLVDPMPGAARLRLGLHDGRRIHTDWFVI